MGECIRFSSRLAASLFALVLGLAAVTSASAEAGADRDATEAVAPLTGRTALLPLIAKHARANAIPEALADAVAHVESAYVSTAVGGVGEIGLMQLRPTTAAMLGFAGSEAELFQPDVNIRYGVLYLAQAWRMTKGDLCRTLMKYRAGHGETRMTQRSVDYCVRARTHLASIGSELADAPVPTAVAAGARRSQGRSAGEKYNKGLWTKHQRKMQAIEQRVTRDSLSIMR